MRPEPLPASPWRQARAEDLAWAREYLVPWVLRRIRHQSSGDRISAKRPAAGPYRVVAAPDAGVDSGSPAGSPSAG
jgi:hypothetical protein